MFEVFVSFRLCRISKRNPRTVRNRSPVGFPNLPKRSPRTPPANATFRFYFRVHQTHEPGSGDHAIVRTCGSASNLLSTLSCLLLSCFVFGPKEERLTRLMSNGTGIVYPRTAWFGLTYCHSYLKERAQDLISSYLLGTTNWTCHF